MAETCGYFLLLNTIINPYYRSCVFMADIYLTISLFTQNGDDTPQNYESDMFGGKGDVGHKNAFRGGGVAGGVVSLS